MRAAFPKVYRSFEEFERDELRKLDGLHVSIDEMLDEMFGEELDFDENAQKGKASGKRTESYDE